MNENERLLVEAIDTMLGKAPHMGVPKPDTDPEEEHSARFMHQEIDEMFALKTVDLVHFEGIRAAFSKIHDYKYVTDPKFYPALLQELRSQGIPGEEQQKATRALTDILEELGSKKGWTEQSAGWNPNLEEILEVGRGESVE